MAKTTKMVEVPVSKLVPYARNAKKHGPEQLEKLKASIEEFGFLTPCLIDRDYNIIAGHGRVMAAKELGLQQVPCVFIEGLTEAQRKAYILADNRLGELGAWDMSIVDGELFALDDMDFVVELTGFDMPERTADWFETRERNDTSREEGNDEYNEFLDKFEIKKTTDDCYTPDVVYEAIAGWVAKEYKLDQKRFVRPFYPGGDYQGEDYRDGDIVVDNPPFSILSEILRFYCERGISFFLFAPSLTLFSGRGLDLCYIPADGDITYENGATVNTSFITNMDDRYMVRTAPELTKVMREANRQNRQEMAKPVNLRYRFPPYVITAAMVGTWASFGVDFKVEKKNGVRISELDAQKQFDKGIYGGAFLLSERAKAEAERAKAEAERAKALEAAKTLKAAKGSFEIDQKTGEIIWQLSERELAIVKSLGGEA